MRHPPLFPVEKSEEDKIKAHIREIVLKSLENLPKNIYSPVEALPNLGVGGSQGFSGSDYILYQPHDFRLYFHFSKQNFSIINLGQNQGFTQGFKIINKTEIFTQNFYNCSLKVRKSTIEVCNKINSKKWFKINLGNDGLINQQMEEIIAKKCKECVDVLHQFTDIFGGLTDYISYKGRCESKFMGDEFIDKLPKGWIFQNSIVKKVYKENNIEFSSPELAMNYASNASLKRFSPEIENRLFNLEKVNLLNFLKENVKSVDDVLIKFREDILRLSPEEKLDFTNWMFISLQKEDEIEVKSVAPLKGAEWSEWSSYFYRNRKVMDLDYSRVRL